MSFSDILNIQNNRMIKQLIPENLQNVSQQLAAIANDVDTIVTGLDNYYVKCLSADTGALLIVASGAVTGQINIANVTPRMSTYTPVAGEYVTLASNLLNAEITLARNSAKKSKVFSSLDARLEETETDTSNTNVNVADLQSKTDLATIDTKTGTSVQSTVADDSIVELKIEGASYQLVTTQGKNLAHDVTYPVANQYIVTVFAKIDNLLPSTQYAISLIIPSGEVFYSNEKIFTASTNAVGDGVSRKTFIVTTKDVLDATQKGVNGWVIFKNNSINTTSGTARDLQIELGSVATAYEPFTPNSPSPDYPALITNAKNFDAVACGKNLLNIPDGTYSNNGITAVVNNNIITVSGVASSNSYISIPIINVLNGAFMLSANNTVVYSGNEVIRLQNTTSGVIHAELSLIAINAYKSLNLNSAVVNSLIIKTGTGTTVNYTLKPQLELGSMVTTFEPYTGNKLTVSQELPKLPNGVCNTIEKGTDGKWRYIQRTIYKSITPVDIITVNNLVYAKVMKPVDYVNYNNYIDTSTACICSHFKMLPYADSALNIGTYNANYAPTYFLMGLPLGTTLAQAASLLSGMMLLYQLKTPIETIITDQKLTTYKGITNIFTTANPQVNLTATFKSRLANSVDTLKLQLASKKQSVITVPTLTNAWVVDGVFGYFLNNFGELEFVGAIKSGTLGASAFTLPTGYRPVTQKRIDVLSNGAFGYIIIGTDGTVKPYGNNVYVSFDGKHFRLDV